MGIASVFLVCTVGKDPELQQSESGKSWCRSRVCVNRWNSSKEVEVAHWFSVTLFGKAAEGWCKRVQKGSAVSLVGNLEEEVSDDERYNGRAGIIVESFEVTHNWVARQKGGERDEAPQNERDTREPAPRDISKIERHKRDDAPRGSRDGRAPGRTQYEGGDGRERGGRGKR